MGPHCRLRHVWRASHNARHRARILARLTTLALVRRSSVSAQCRLTAFGFAPRLSPSRSSRSAPPRSARAPGTTLRFRSSRKSSRRRPRQGVGSMTTRPSRGPISAGAKGGVHCKSMSREFDSRRVRAGRRTADPPAQGAIRGTNCASGDQAYFSFVSSATVVSSRIRASSARRSGSRLAVFSSSLT